MDAKNTKIGGLTGLVKISDAMKAFLNTQCENGLVSDTNLCTVALVNRAISAYVEDLGLRNATHHVTPDAVLQDLFKCDGTPVRQSTLHKMMCAVRPFVIITAADVQKYIDEQRIDANAEWMRLENSKTRKRGPIDRVRGGAGGAGAGTVDAATVGTAT